MKLITKDDLLPKLYETDGTPEDQKIAHLKWFTPDSSWTWYVFEYDPEERVAFTLAKGHDVELGYVSLEELEGVRGPLGLEVERDLYWIPISLDLIRKKIAEGNPP